MSHANTMTSASSVRAGAVALMLLRLTLMGVGVLFAGVLFNIIWKAML
jgi:hypothetical protein